MSETNNAQNLLAEDVNPDPEVRFPVGFLLRLELAVRRP